MPEISIQTDKKNYKKTKKSKKSKKTKKEKKSKKTRSRPKKVNHNKSMKIIRSPTNGESYSTTAVSNSKYSVKNAGEPTWVRCNQLFDILADSNEQAVNNLFEAFYGQITTPGLLFTSANATVNQLFIQANLDQSNLSVELDAGDKTQGRKVYCEYLHSETLLTNATNMDTEIIIYDVVANQNRDVDGEASFSPYDVWEGAMEMVENDQFRNITKMDEIPTKHTYFNYVWKTVGCHRVHLSAGRTHVHKFKYDINRLVDLQIASKGRLIRGVSCSTLIITRGIQAVSGSTGITEQICIGTNPTRVYGKVTNEYKVRPVYAVPKKYLVYDNTLLFVEPASVDLINQFTGAVVPGLNS